MRVIGNAELVQTLTAPIALELAAIAAKLGGCPGRYFRPERQFHPVNPHGAKFGVMPLVLHDPALLGLKIINIFPANAAVGKPTHVGVYQLYSGETGEPFAMMDANLLTGIRTAAMTAYATHHIAPELTDQIAIIGTGDQAAWHVRTLGALFHPKELFVAGRSLAAALRLVDLVADELPDVQFHACSTEEAVKRASVICTVTSSAEPVVDRAWLSHRTHINAIGAHSADCAELDPEIFEGADCHTDDPDTFPTHCAEYLRLRASGKSGPKRILGIWEPRASPSHATEITVYKSFGTAVQDIVFAAYAAGLRVTVE